MDEPNSQNQIDQILTGDQKTPSPPKEEKKPITHEAPRVPYVTLSQANRSILLLTLVTILLAATTILLAVAFFSQINRKPWIVGYSGGVYSELEPQRYRVTRDDVEVFLGEVIPKLYGTIQGEAPGLDMLGQVVNPDILATQRENINKQRSTLKEQGISQFALVTGIIPSTLVINRSENFIYAEATGVVMLTRQNRSTPSEVQWRCLLYIVDPLSSQESKTPGGRVAGNQYGLYLQQIVEQRPGTVNPDSPRPTTQDEQERKEQELRRAQNNTPTLKLQE